jgi:hypothetical protein
LKTEYFDAIGDGTKTEEYRLATNTTAGLLAQRELEGIVLTKGQPIIDDPERRLKLPWCGFSPRTIIRPLSGPHLVEDYEIALSVKK